MSEEDPKIVARNERRTPEAEKLMRQFSNTDGPKGVTNAYRKVWDRMHSPPPVPFAVPVKCLECAYVAADLMELEWHEEQTHHEFHEGE